MGWLTDWDDIVHGTVVFGAALPFGLVVLLGWRLPGRSWMAVAAALAVSIFWIFGWPSWPLKGSDDAVTAGFIVSISLVALESMWQRASFTGVLFRAIVWTGLSWTLYPAWLVAEGGNPKRLMIVSSMGFTIAAWAALMEYLSVERKGTSNSAACIAPAAWVPPSIALSVLLVVGGASRFAQSSGALAAAIGAVCVLLFFGRGPGLRPVAGLWGMLSALLAWSGWLFAEIHVWLTLALVLCPFAALAMRKIPLPRSNRFLEQLWDGLAAALIAGMVIGVSWIEYRKGGDSLGY